MEKRDRIERCWKLIEILDRAREATKPTFLPRDLGRLQRTRDVEEHLRSAKQEQWVVRSQLLVAQRFSRQHAGRGPRGV